MAVGVQFKLDRRFAKQAKGVFEKYTFDVGVLEDADHKLPTKIKIKTGGKIEPGETVRGLKTFAGGPARRTRRKSSGKTIAQVSEDVRKRLGINFYTRPFKSRKNAEILKFIKSFFDLCAGRAEKRRCENFLQAIVRNPILRGDYGSNSPAAAKNKGFNRLLIDTAQLFKAIKARVNLRVSK